MSTELHETRDELPAELLDVKRAIDSMKEELEAIDWYAQRAEATGDAELRDILRHNRREEIEHFAMLLEWLRRRSPEIDQLLRRTLFKPGDVTDDGDPDLREQRAASEVGRGERRTLGSLIASEPGS